MLPSTRRCRAGPTKAVEDAGGGAWLDTRAVTVGRLVVAGRVQACSEDPPLAARSAGQPGSPRGSALRIDRDDARPSKRALRPVVEARALALDGAAAVASASLDALAYRFGLEPFGEGPPLNGRGEGCPRPRHRAVTTAMVAKASSRRGARTDPHPLSLGSAIGTMTELAFKLRSLAGTRHGGD